MDIKGKKIIVTGGAKGIGLILVHKLIQVGAIVGVFDIDARGLNNLKKDSENIYCHVCDVSDYKQVTAVVDKFYQKFKAIDGLVNNAGLIYNSPLITLTTGKIKKHDLAMWHKVINTDLSSVFYLTVNVVEKMVLNRTKGIIVNISSVCAAGNAGQGAYSAAKAGINALTATWAKELGLMGIRVVSVAPGFTETETMKQSMSDAVVDAWKAKTPLRRLGQPEEIADGIIAIIKNEFFNGKVFELDGGLHV